MSAIPTPREALELRALYADNPLIDDAEKALRAFARDLHVRVAAKLLETWAHFAELTDRERSAVVARFVPAPAERCARCGGPVEYVANGPQPGWWGHSRLTTGWPAHPAVPDYGAESDDAAGNSGAGWPMRGAR